MERPGQGHDKQQQWGQQQRRAAAVRDGHCSISAGRPSHSRCGACIRGAFAIDERAAYAPHPGCCCRAGTVHLSNTRICAPIWKFLSFARSYQQHVNRGMAWHRSVICLIFCARRGGLRSTPQCLPLGPEGVEEEEEEGEGAKHLESTSSRMSACT
jgi:hypothetical protein